MSRKILIIGCLFIMALFVTNSAIAQSLTADRPLVNTSPGATEQVNVTLDLMGAEFMYWVGPIIEEGNDKVQISFADLMGSGYEGMSTLSNNRRSRRVIIKALAVGLAKILVKVIVMKNDVVEILEVFIDVDVSLFSPQEIPVIEQGVLAIDYFAIKED